MKTSRSTAMSALLCITLIWTLVFGQPVAAGPAEVSLSGRLIVGIAETDPPSPIYTLEAEDGRTVRLFLTEGAVLPAEGLGALHGHSVTVTGQWAKSYLQGQGSPALIVQSVRLAETGRIQAADVSISDISGSKPWVWILCKFSGDADEPVTPAQVATQAAGLDPYFQEVSYNKANITGSYVVTQWYTLPQPKSYYVYDMDSDGANELDTTLAATDCTALADATVDFTEYYGINLMFNDPLTAAGLTTWVSLSLDGEPGPWPTVFIGDSTTAWLDNMELNAHEMYHGFGLGHSAVRNADGTVKAGNQWDPVGVGACGFSSCTALHIPAPQKAELGWIAAAKTYTATLATQTVDLEALAQPQTSNYLMAKIPLEDRHFYTVEARRPVGYDSKVPGPAVLIHEVNTRSGAFTNGHIGIIPAEATSQGSYGARWTVGKGPFVDSTFGVTVTVVTTLTTGFRVRIEVAPIKTTVLYVKANAAGANNGTSWANAYMDLQDALAAANPTGRDRVEIWVAQGTYKPTSTTDRTAAFGLKSNVRIYGGFDGTETARSQRNITTYPTVLSGDLLGNDTANIATDEPTRSENSYHVIIDSANVAGLLDGVTVLGGNANGGSSPDDQGGGMYSNTGNSILRNVTFKNNTASNAGGGVYVADSTLRLVNVTFANNKSNSVGGGLGIHDGTPHLIQVVFSGNIARYRGGAIVNSFGDLTLINTTVSGNTATYYSNSAAAGIYNYGNSSHLATVKIVNSIFWGNTDRMNGNGTLAQLTDNGYGTFDVSYSLVQGSSIYTGTGNTNLNPLFVDANGADNIVGTADDNLRLQRGSPAVDSGSNAAISADVADLDNDENTSEQTPRDMDGKTRIMSPFDADPLLVDMGPYEFPSISVYLPTVMRNQ